jgi:hypothetical protein
MNIYKNIMSNEINAIIEIIITNVVADNVFDIVKLVSISSTFYNISDRLLNYDNSILCKKREIIVENCNRNDGMREAIKLDSRDLIDYFMDDDPSDDIKKWHFSIKFDRIIDNYMKGFKYSIQFSNIKMMYFFMKKYKNMYDYSDISHYLIILRIGVKYASKYENIDLIYTFINLYKRIIMMKRYRKSYEEDKSCDSNFFGTIIGYIAKYNHKDILIDILNFYIDESIINSINFWEKTMTFATESGNIDIVNLLIERYMPSTMLNNNNNLIKYHSIEGSSQSGNIEFVKYMIKLLKLNEINNCEYMNRGMECAAIKYDLDMIKFFEMEYNADHYGYVIFHCSTWLDGRRVCKDNDKCKEIVKYITEKFAI